MESMFTRPNGQKVSVEEIAEIVAEYISSDRQSQYEITVGTDSQNYDKTKIAEVIAVHRVGSGGIFFYRIDFVRRIDNLRQKIQEETQRSLAIADNLLEKLELSIMGHDLDMDHIHVHFQIHCDVGYEGKTKVLIQEIVGWVRSSGYECQIKPQSFAASSVANKFSK